MQTHLDIQGANYPAMMYSTNGDGMKKIVIVDWVLMEILGRLLCFFFLLKLGFSFHFLIIFINIFSFRWTPGQWVGGQARPLKWMEASVKPPVYEFKETLDYWALADWVRQSAVTRFTDSVKSQIICEANLLTSSLDTILCDCVADDEDNCYEQSTTSIEVGIRDVCAGEVSILKGPSNNILFHESSVKSRCTIVELGMLRKSAFAVSRDKASVSFQFDTPAQPGVVLNQKGATVGKLFGDGAVLLFEKPKLVRNFRACLRITVDEAAEVKDFGYTIGSVIHPLGLDIEVFFVVFFLFCFCLVT